jgi:type IV secretion system protein TrbL
MNRLASVMFAMLLLASFPAMAGLTDATAASDGLLMLIKNSASTWSGVLRGYATDIFWILATIQFVWTFSFLALRQADYAEMMAELLKFVVITVFFYGSLLLHSVEWARMIIDSFRQVAAEAAGVPFQLHPGDMFGLGIELGKTVSGIGLVNPVTAFIAAISVVLIVLCFTFIAAFMLVTLAQSYVVIYAGVFFMAFGGSQWTREYALAMLRYSVAVGLKLFVLTLIVGLIMTAARSWQAAYTQDETSMLTLAGLSFICAYLSKTLPEMIQELISGVSSGGGSPLGGMIAAGMAGVAAGAAGVSAATSGAGLGGAGKSVADLIKSSFSGPGSSGGSGGGASPMNFMSSGGGSPGGGSSGGGSSARTGGGGYSQPPGTPPSGKSASSQSPGSSSGNQSASSSAGQAASSGSVAGSLHAAAHTATEAAVRGVGIMGSLAVPGMEGSSGVSIGPPPTPPDLSDLGETPENVIRPESTSPFSGNDSADVSEVVAASSVDTMSSLQNALTNRGKA